MLATTKETPLNTRKIFPLLALLALAVATSGCLRMVEPGYVALEIKTCGANAGDYETRGTGRTSYNPFCTQFYDFPTSLQNAVWSSSTNEGNKSHDQSILFTSADGQPIKVNVSIDYQFDPEKVGTMFDQFRVDQTTFVNTFLYNRTRDAFNDCVVTPTDAQLAADYEGPKGMLVQDVFADRRTELFICVEDTVSTDLDPYGVHIGQISLIGEFGFPQAVRDSIAAKVQATQDAETAENQLREADAAAEKQRIEAEGAAAAAMALATGEAQAQLTRAQAEAESNRLISQSLTERLVDYRRIERWDGKQPTTVLGAETGAFITVGGNSN